MPTGTTIKPTAAGQRQYLTILFSDLSDSTRLSATMEPEIYSDLLTRLRGLFFDIAARHGGEIVRIDGDGIICIFGHNAPVEDGGRRAVETAIDFHSAAGLFDPAFAAPDCPVRMHSGIHAGVVLVSEGDMVRGRYEILGDATNLAAHLCGCAGPDEIVASEAALGPDQGFFTLAPRRLLRPRGASQDMGVYTITGRADAPSRFDAWSRRGVSPIVGRDAELARLLVAHSACRAGLKAICVVVGASGMGKTRLVSEFVHRLGAGNFPAHRGYCEAYLGARPLQPIMQIVRSMIAHASAMEPIAPPALSTVTLRRLVGSGHAATLSWLLGGAAASADFPAPDLADLGAAILCLIDADSDPLTLCIDDWQWADEASIALLDRVLRSAKRSILVVMALRGLDQFQPPAGALDKIRLAPLSGGEARQTIQHIIVNRDFAAPSSFLVERIVEQAGGCPLFIEELCHAVQEGDFEQISGTSGQWLDALIQSRFAALPPDLSQLVRQASVIGHIIPVRLLEGIAGRDIDAATVERLGHADFIYAGETRDHLRFKHSVTRDAIYRTVGLDERRALHARLVEQLLAADAQQPGYAELELLSYHCAASGDVRRAAVFAMEAGHRAMAASALDRAQAQYLAAFQAYKALAGPDQSAVPLADIVGGYGRSCVVDPSKDQVRFVQEMIAMAREDRDDKALALALYWLGSIRYGLGEARASIALLTQALPIARAQQWDSLAAQIGAGLGQGWFDAGRCDLAERLLTEAISAMAGNLAPHRIPPYLYAIADRAQIFAERGAFDSADRDFAVVNRVIGGDQPAVLCSLLTKQAGACIWKGDYDKALHFAQAAETQGLRHHSRINVMIGQALSGYAKFLLDGDKSAVARLVDATNWLERASHGHRISLFYGWSADVMATLGNIGQTRHFAARAFRRARVGDGFGQGSAARALARAVTMSGGPRWAGHYLAVAYRSAERRQSGRAHAETLLCEAEIAMAVRDPARGRSCAQQALSAFRSMGMTPHISCAEALLATDCKPRP